MKSTSPLKIALTLISFILFAFHGYTQNGSTAKQKNEQNPYSGLKFRSIGPALMSGRIADIAIDPKDENTWYIAVGSGGVWKTINAGITWQALFDKQAVYSIGCISIDPGNSNRIWVGTGENVGGRHVGYGDGIYRSDDGGATWKNMGLKTSEHISKIIIHPNNPDIVWVASQGPLWSSGGERGIFKTTDGGETWQRTLGDGEFMGATDILIDPRNPDRLYAASWERHRNVAVYVGGGPGSGIYRSEDGGLSWTKLKTGLPSKNMGKIGLAISPQQPDVIYAAIELERRTGGIYRSSDRGASWQKMSPTVSGATGPHYYQELYASPHAFDRIYLADVRMRVSEDGGKTFRTMKEEHKHSDNHAMSFRVDDPDYLLVGTDGGLYESYDLEENWRFIGNLPLTQFYKLALDDTEPFYNIYGGTQDNSTQMGPSRTLNHHGIRNADWSVVLGGDGHQPATEPGNPAIVYAESQEGYLHRLDMTTGERVFIQPQRLENDGGWERFNWDSPILVSPHQASRIYFASQRVWRSDDRGDSWTPISGDLTKDQERLTLPISGQTWSWDSHWDIYAMSTFNTITSISESPIQEGLIYIGTDDGIIQVTEDGGNNWRRINVDKLPGVPESAFINDIKADLFDANTVYVVLDDHKSGDLEPYILKSDDRGKSWKSIRSNLPSKTLAWRVVQDHVDKDLFFLATEFGIYFTNDGAEQWTQLKGGLPTISFRDLAIQRRENDLVAASFGRSFYILDDYSCLRQSSSENLESEAVLFPVRDALWYLEEQVLGHAELGYQGASYYAAENPPFGAVITYYLKDAYPSMKQQRQKSEKAALEENDPIVFPGWDAVEAERRESEPRLWLLIRDSVGNTVRRLTAINTKGFNRIAWNLRYPSSSAIGTASNPWQRDRGGIPVLPGTYTVSLYLEHEGEMSQITDAVDITVKYLRQGHLPGSPIGETAAFWKDVSNLRAGISASSQQIKHSRKKLQMMQIALSRSSAAPGVIERDLAQLSSRLYELEEKLSGHKSRDIVGEKGPLSIQQRLGVLGSGVSNSSYGPTPMLKAVISQLEVDYADLREELNRINTEIIPELENRLMEAGAPWTPGQKLPE